MKNKRVKRNLIIALILLFILIRLTKKNKLTEGLINVPKDDCEECKKKAKGVSDVIAPSVIKGDFESKKNFYKNLKPYEPSLERGKQVIEKPKGKITLPPSMTPPSSDTGDSNNDEDDDSENETTPVEPASPLVLYDDDDLKIIKNSHRYMFTNKTDETRFFIKGASKKSYPYDWYLLGENETYIEENSTSFVVENERATSNDKIEINGTQVVLSGYFKQ